MSTPVYKAGISGLLKSFVDLIDNDLLIGKPVIIAATSGTARHEGSASKAAHELTQVIKPGVGRAVADAAWSGYKHEFAGRAVRAERTTQDLDFDSTLMQLAAGGARQNQP